MRRSCLLALMLTFVLVFSVGVLAENDDDGDWTSSEYWDEYGYDDFYDMSTDGIEDNDDGIIWSNLADPNNSDYVNLNELNRSSYTADVNGNQGDAADNDQKLEIELPVLAYIPCYLEITLTGNEGKSSLQSFGPGASETGGTLSGTTGPPSGYLGYQLVFDNEIGGFIDENWMSMGAAKNAEIEPGSDVYIAGCDIFKVDVYGNEAYTYEVQSSPLGGIDNNSTLNMDIRTSRNLGNAWFEETTISNTDQIAFDYDYEAGKGGTFLHNFRVPYTRNSVHGSYSGAVIFRVVSR